MCTYLYIYCIYTNDCLFLSNSFQSRMFHSFELLLSIVTHCITKSLFHDSLYFLVISIFFLCVFGKYFVTLVTGLDEKMGCMPMKCEKYAKLFVREKNFKG